MLDDKKEIIYIVGRTDLDTNINAKFFRRVSKYISSDLTIRMNFSQVPSKAGT